MKQNTLNKTSLLANTKGQSLKKHSLAVAFYGHLLLRSLKFNPEIEKNINKCLILSALLHDIGKTSKFFQDFIKKHINKENGLRDFPTDAESMRKKSFKGPYHNEISWAYTANFIEISNPVIENIIHHSVYWHHPANYDEKTGELRFKDSEKVFDQVKNNNEKNNFLYEIKDFVSDLFCSFHNIYGEKIESVDLFDPSYESISDTIHPPDFFSHKQEENSKNAKKQLCLNLLLEADRSISQWETEKLNDFLKQISESKKAISSWTFDKSKAFFEKWSESQKNLKENKIFPITENLSANQKSQNQYKLAEKMSNKQLSVCGVDPAGGKTSIALYWWSKSNNRFPLMIALPRQHQVTGLFHSLKKDCQRIYDNSKIKIEGVFNGKRAHDNWNPEKNSDLLISNINLMVFDRFLSPYYKRSQSSEFIKMLSSHLVLDEFHEFKNIPKMIPSLKEILTIREWLESGVKTVMLSGTPEPPLLKLLNVENNNIFKRKQLSPREDHKFKISFKNNPPENQFIQDCLYSFLRVEDCQKYFVFLEQKYQDKIKLIHSYFTSKDKKRLIEDILKNHGFVDSRLSEKAVVTAKMLQSSYNLSFKKSVLELSQPDTDCQTAGRVNRFGNKSQAEMQFFYNDKTEHFFSESRGAGFKEIHLAWKTHLQNFIEKNKEKAVPVRKLMECYDDFWTEENIKKSTKILTKQQKKAIEDLNKYIPKRFISNKKNKKSFLSLNSLFRGESRLLSACVVDNNGRAIGQLQDEDLLSEGRAWLIQEIKSAMKFCLKTKEKCKKANIIQNEVFDYNKHISKYAGFGYKTDRPLLCSHFNAVIDQCLKQNLEDPDNKKTYHKVYHPKFGLVKKEFIKSEK